MRLPRELPTHPPLPAEPVPLIDLSSDAAALDALRLRNLEAQRRFNWRHGDCL
jgi:hypothetical protein